MIGWTAVVAASAYALILYVRFYFKWRSYQGRPGAEKITPDMIFINIGLPLGLFLATAPWWLITLCIICVPSSLLTLRDVTNTFRFYDSRPS